jgi:hypothetical protein
MRPSDATLWSNLHAAFQRLFVGPGLEEWFRFVDAPLVNPVLAPLLVLGVLHGFRRWESPWLRLLTVWVIGGALLPPIVGGVLPRRSLLMLPAAFGLIGLVLDELTTALAQVGRSGRVAGAVLGMALVVAVTTTDAATFFRRWNEGWDANRPGVLKLRRAIKYASGARRILLALDPVRDPDPHLIYFAHVEDDPVSGFRPPQRRRRRRGTPAPPPESMPSPVPTAIEIRDRSCATEKPLVWIASDTEPYRAAFDALRGRFVYTEESHGPYRLYRVTDVVPDGCAGVPTSPSG